MKAYAAFTQASSIEHFVIKTKPGQKTASATHHIPNINNLHSRNETFIKPFRGPASKYLEGYLQWFIARIGKVPPGDVLRAV